MIAMYPKENLDAAVWIDLLDPTADEISRVTNATGLRIPTQNEISEIESTSRLAFEGNAYYVSAPLLAPGNDDDLVSVPVGFLLNAKVLITVRFAALPSIDATHSKCAASEPHTAEEAFLRIFEVVVDRSADKLELASAESDALSRITFRGDVRAATSKHLQNTLRRVGWVADRTSMIRDSLLVLGRVTAFVMEGGIATAPPVNVARLKSIRADIASLTEYEAHLTGKVQFLLDATLGFINIEQNEIVKTLTIASVVGIPPVLIVGIYGMNFHYMPELDWHFGYPMAMVVMIVSGLLPLIWFKRRGWM
ncbi:MAG: magnesium transporter CorA family protein [Polyangiaceae bacterium]